LKGWGRRSQKERGVQPQLRTEARSRVKGDGGLRAAASGTPCAEEQVKEGMLGWKGGRGFIVGVAVSHCKEIRKPEGGRSIR
jgi:hypothetical protein